jgi:hypothetical protein
VVGASEMATGAAAKRAPRKLWGRASAGGRQRILELQLPPWRHLVSIGGPPGHCDLSSTKCDFLHTALALTAAFRRPDLLQAEPK